MFELHTIDPCKDVRWPEFLKFRSDSSVFHTRGWLEALRRTYGYEPVVYTTSPPGRPLRDGLLFCRINSWLTGKRLVSVPFSDHAALLTDVGDGLWQMFSFLQQQAKENIYKYVEIRPIPLPKADPPGFGENATFYWHKLSLDEELGSLYKSFHKNSVQRKIRRAEREGLTYTEGRSEQ